MRRTRNRTQRTTAARLALALGTAALFAAGTLHAAGPRAARVKEVLAPTSAAPDARGRVKLLIKSSSRAKLKLLASKLEGGRSYDLLVGGVKVGTLSTSPGGVGRASFSASPGARDAMLGFDPRGEQMTVRDQEDGDDVLVGDLPADDPASVACCLIEADDDGPELECEDLTAEECAAAGGTPQAADSCLPNPCATAPPVGEELVCCTNATHDDESEAECEEVATAAECAALDGTLIAAASCDDDPCNGAAPVDRTACCVPDDDGSGEIDCEVLSTAACVARGGTTIGTGTGTAAATCGGDPCGSDDGSEDEDGGPGDDGDEG